MKEIFDDYIANSFGDSVQSSAKFRQFLHNYRRFFPNKMDADILDIGIGRGEMLSCLKTWGYSKSRGIDISLSTVNFCRGINLNVELVSDTESWLADNVNSFDVITLLDVLEHINKESLVSFLRAIKNSLKDGGVLIIQTPNAQSPDFQLHRYNDITHEFCFSEHSLSQLLITVGFSSFSFSGFEIYVGNKNLFLEFGGRVLRFIYLFFIRVGRKINTNLNPRILNPVFLVSLKNE